MEYPSEEVLANAIEIAAESAILELFAIHKEPFYYCSLITDGEAHTPTLVAWSIDALSKVCSDSKKMQVFKWSYADSPYLGFGDRFFMPVKELFDRRPQLNSDMTELEWIEEFNIRLNAMEVAMRRLDEKGIFSRSQLRNAIVVNVEVMPPDYGNTERAYRLNPIEALTDWLSEIAEEAPSPN